jgi:hypothetical protein
MTDMQAPAGGEFRDGAPSPLMPRPPARGEQHSSVDATDDLRSRPVAPEGRPFAQWWALVLDGRHGWGSLDISPTRHGVTRYQLGAVLTPGAAFATSTIAYLASGAVLFAQVAELRSRVRTLSVVRIAGYTDDRSAAMFVELKSLVAALGLADSQRARGQSSSADHEATWWRAYDRLGQNHPGPATC